MTDHGYALVAYRPGCGVPDDLHGPYMSESEAATAADLYRDNDRPIPSRYVVVRLVAVSDDAR